MEKIKFNFTPRPPQSFKEENKELISFFNLSSYIFQIVSMTAAFIFLSSLFAESITGKAAAAVLVLMIEITKRKSVVYTIRSINYKFFLRSYRWLIISIFAFVCSVSVLYVSIDTSIRGSEQMTSIQASAAPALKAEQEIKQAQLRIKEIESDKARQWKGRLVKEARQEIETLQSVIIPALMEKAKKEALNHADKVTEHKKTSLSKYAIIKNFVLYSELLFLISIIVTYAATPNTTDTAERQQQPSKQQIKQEKLYKVEQPGGNIKDMSLSDLSRYINTYTNRTGRPNEEKANHYKQILNTIKAGQDGES